VATGNPVDSSRKRDNYFSEEMWSDAALHYQVSVGGLSEDCWEHIIDGTWRIAQERPVGRCAPTLSRLPVAQLPEVDERELLVETTDGVHVEDDEDIDWDARSEASNEVCEFLSSFGMLKVY
jgi:hypothetical protein